ncbi:MAG: AEC family transporter, partial [Pseudomonadota bacterium]
METVTEIVTPVFGIGLLGYFATRLGWFSAEAGAGLARFVFNFAIPALLVRTFANTELPDTLPLDLLGAYYLPVAIFYVGGMLLARSVFHRPLAGQTITGFSSSYGNGVMLGLPLMLLIFGDTASLPYFILLSVHALSLFTTTTVLLEFDRHRDARIANVTANVLLGLIRNPILIGIVTGITLNFLNMPL